MLTDTSQNANHEHWLSFTDKTNVEPLERVTTPLFGEYVRCSGHGPSFVTLVPILLSYYSSVRQYIWSTIREKKSSCTAMQICKSHYGNSDLGNMSWTLRQLMPGECVSKSHYGNMCWGNVSRNRVVATCVWEKHLEITSRLENASSNCVMGTSIWEMYASDKAFTKLVC